MKLILINWIDSRGGSPHWRTVSDAVKEGCCAMQSVGWLIQDTKEHLHIAAHIGLEDDGDHQCHGDMVIPKIAITKTRVLK